MTNPPPARPLRADAVRNRQLLLSAAAAAFAEQGTNVSIAEIAQRAGVGKGTVFRHFASKEDLIAAIMGELIDRLVSVGTGLSDAADPAAALFEFMTVAIERLTEDRALCDVIGRPSLQVPAVQAGINGLCEVVEVLTARARLQGAIRHDITGQDIVLLLAGVHQTAAPLMDTLPQLWRRYLRLVFDGLRSQTSEPLPHPLPARLEFASPDSLPAVTSKTR
jgi:AcrR family transcriptional regulator